MKKRIFYSWKHFSQSPKPSGNVYKLPFSYFSFQHLGKSENTLRWKIENFYQYKRLSQARKSSGNVESFFLGKFGKFGKYVSMKNLKFYKKVFIFFNKIIIIF